MGYVLITGGSFKNKGAQSMVFITVDEMKKRFPDKEIVVISDADAAAEQAALQKDGTQSNFRFLLRDSVCLYGWKYKLLQHRYGKLDTAKDASQIRKNTDMIIDISGYTFGSNFGWMSSLLAAYRAKRAKTFGVPIYYMPQSFGPFDWTSLPGKITAGCMKKWLPYAKVLYAREEEGYELLKSKFGLTNVALSEDLVLQNTGIDLENVYVKVPQYDIPKAAEGSVAVLPNIRNYKYGNLPQLMQGYRTIIDTLLAHNRTVYLVRHATEDLDFCRKIKEMYEKEERVILLEKDFTCLEYEEFVKQFDYLVASRYHSIVHAYKQGVPCLVLGWAVKYQELLKKAAQEQYALDVRKNIEPDKVRELVERMENGWQQEAGTIRQKIALLQQKNVFDCIGGTNDTER